MATTNTYSGSTVLSITGTNTFSTDNTGSRASSVSTSLTWAASGGTAPTISGFFKGTATWEATAPTDWRFADADPLKLMGSATWSDGFTTTAGKIKLLYIENTDATNSWTVTRGATTTGDAFPMLAAAGDALVLAAGDFACLYSKAGGPLMTTSNDKLSLTVGGGTPTATVFCLAGP